MPYKLNNNILNFSEVSSYIHENPANPSYIAVDSTRDDLYQFTSGTRNGSSADTAYNYSSSFLDTYRVNNQGVITCMSVPYHINNKAALSTVGPSDINGYPCIFAGLGKQTNGGLSLSGAGYFGDTAYAITSSDKIKFILIKVPYGGAPSYHSGNNSTDPWVTTKTIIERNANGYAFDFVSFPFDTSIAGYELQVQTRINNKDSVISHVFFKCEFGSNSAHTICIRGIQNSGDLTVNNINAHHPYTGKYFYIPEEVSLYNVAQIPLTAIYSQKSL